jgi:mRNA interferase MazF
MTRYSPGDIVLVRFPFTDLTTTKKRPALVISPREYCESYGDVVIVALTGRDQKDEDLKLTDWSSAGLLKDTWIKPATATINENVIDKKLGTLNADDIPKVSYAIRRLIDRRFLPE